MRTRRKVVRVRVASRRATSALRVLPDFLIIGAQRCGTSSLYKYLSQHRAVAPSIRKEVEYFSRMYGNGLGWYRAHFPLRGRRIAGYRCGPQHLQTFEATPDYLFHPHAPGRAAQLLPDARIVVMLRNPADRAFSHYRHMARLGFETLSFEKAIEAEKDRLADDVEMMQANPLHDCKSYFRYSYVSRGLYASQLQRWMQVYPRKSFFILQSEEFYRHPEGAFGELLEFLGLERWTPREFPNFSYLGGAPIEPPVPRQVHDYLARHFAPHNLALYELIGRDLGW